ncbi:MAG TPA: hypothetical protein VKV40_15855 [Ktedonobacteraceae bacterium]|nr:hypothetical protein [Ktedonobacteraceae bacterium]
MKILLSCISTKHSVLKQHWAETGQVSACPLTTLGSYQKPKDDTGGLLCSFDDGDGSQKTIDLKLAAGMVPTDDGVLVTSFGSVHRLDASKNMLQHDVVSSLLFNALHSISRTHQGYLVASTGLDLLVEFDRAGKILWTWWATDHGFDLTPNGQRRIIDRDADHRTIQYGTLSQTTHVNAAAELPDGNLLASLFHQGMVILINRKNGAWQPVLEGLDHPHAVRVLDEEHFTVADTVRGRALLARIKKDGGHIEQVVEAETNWLQDCRYDGQYQCWVLVDGKNSRILLRRGLSGEKTLAEFNFDPEWRLYEAYILA